MRNINGGKESTGKHRVAFRYSTEKIFNIKLHYVVVFYTQKIYHTRAALSNILSAVAREDKIQMTACNVDELINFLDGRRRQIRNFVAREKSADVQRNIFRD